MERGAVPRALAPPIRGGVDHRIPSRLAVVGVDEVLHPAYHRRGAEAVAGRARGVVFDVEHAREGAAVGGPAAAVGEEVGRLSGAGGGSRLGEVIAAADEAGGGGTAIVRGEGGVNVVGAFCGLRMGGRALGWWRKKKGEGGGVP